MKEDDAITIVREERKTETKTGDIDQSVARNLDRFFAPEEAKEVYSMGQVYYKVPGLAAVCQMLERELEQLEGVVEAWGVPLKPREREIRQTVHEFFQMTRSIQGTGNEQGKEVLSSGVARFPPMGPGMPQFGNPLLQQQPLERVDEHGKPIKKRFWQRD